MPFAVSTLAFLAPPPLQLAHVRLEPGRDAHQLISFPPPPPPLQSPPPLPPSPHTLISQMMVYMLKKAWHDDLSPLNNQFNATAFNRSSLRCSRFALFPPLTWPGQGIHCPTLQLRYSKENIIAEARSPQRSTTADNPQMGSAKQIVARSLLF